MELLGLVDSCSAVFRFSTNRPVRLPLEQSTQVAPYERAIIDN